MNASSLATFLRVVRDQFHQFYRLHQFHQLQQLQRLGQARSPARIHFRKNHPFGSKLILGIAVCVLVIAPGLFYPPEHDAIAMLPPEQTIETNQTIAALPRDPATINPPINPSNPDTDRSSGEWERSGRAALQRQDYTQAERNFKAAISAYERAEQWAAAAGSAYMLSRTYFDMGALDAATIALEQGFRCLDILDNLESPPSALQAQLQMQRGQLQQAEGLIETAIESWQRALLFYQDSDDPVGIIATQLNLAAAHQTLGLYPQARQLLMAVGETIETSNNGTINHETINHETIENTELQTLNLLQVADIELALGERETAQMHFETAYQLASRHHFDTIRSTLLSRLARLANDRGDRLGAAELYRDAAKINPGSPPAIAAELGAIQCEIEIEIQRQADSSERESPQFEIALRELFDRTLALPESQAKSQLQVYLTERIRSWEQVSALWAVPPRELAEGLRDGLVHRREAGDHRTQAQILDALAQLYHDRDELDAAIKLTQDAIALATQAHAREMLAMYHHHLGRLLLEAQHPAEALTSYRQAIGQLRTLRHSDALSNTESQISFQMTVEPIYREAIRLLLQDNANQAAIQEARDILEALQLAEIENYFRENCLTSQPINVGEIDPQAAIIYPIVLPDRLEILLSLPNARMQRHTVPQPASVTIASTAAARSSLSRLLGINEQQDALQRLHHWLIEPFSADLEQANIETLVFVLDAPFRSIPMAALFDGQHYAIERYNIALAPSLQLLETTRRTNGLFSVFIGGLEAARQGFRSLPGVRDEAEAIADRVPSELRLDEQFTLQRLKEALRYSSHPIIHLATHGQFGSTPESTFVLTWDGKLDLTAFRDELLSRDEVRHGAIDLLVLSACETAIGDQLAILGMAGFAVQSGARATIASLWGVNDDATARQMTFLYEALARQDMSKAEALREAQLKTIALGGDYAKPFYWAPFVLIGNWL